MISCGCNNKFQSSCIKSAKILSDAKKLIKQMEMVDNEIDGKIINTTVSYDNSEYKKFMNNKYYDLKGHYDVISAYANPSGEYYLDSIMATTFINIHLDYYIGRPFDDKYKYLQTIKKNIGNIQLKEWILNDFWKPLITNKSSIKIWNTIGNKEKYEMILLYIFSIEKTLSSGDTILN
jgi:hypothetical protein